ncbi:protein MICRORCHIDIA 6 isoform X2 [Morus notabilis]|uniref:protein MICRORCHIDIA 6 isoform X2 n=1 Tax=Morus notabilis TaxID=981085 RepID=UPI000CED32D6|nr:protein MICRORCHIDIA 6 isoform X2 [Morus notabilis]
MTLIDVVDLSSDDELEELDVKAVKLEPDSIGSMTQQKANSKVQLAKNQISKTISTRQDYQENRSLNASSTAHSSSCVLDQVQSTMDDASLSSTLFASPAPLCRHFWKAGNYDDRLVSKVAHQNGKNYLHVHPLFLHSNATSHKWAFGAIAELLDNAVDEIQNGATFVAIDKISNPRDGSSALLIKDDGGGMSPEAMRRCMSFGFTDKKAKTAIGRYGNGFKTSTMRLGADVIVFSRHIDNRIFTQSIGLLSYTFLRKTGKDRIAVPMVHYEFNTAAEKLNYLQGKEHFMSNLETILKWAPFSTETELLQQFDDIGPHGTKVVIYNLWFTDDGIEEFDFNTDPKDIRISGDAKSVDTLPAWKKLNEQHIVFLCSQVYLSILYLRLPETFRIILRGEVVKHHNIADDLKYLDYILYKPQCGGGVEAQVVTTIGYLKEAPQLIIHGFNVYHKNRLILPFWQVVRFIDNKGRGIVGILEANFVEPTHNKQDFEKTSLFQKLETRLKEMTMEYFDHHCALVGYQVKTKPKRQSTSLVSNGDAPIILDHNPAPIGFTEVALGRPRSEQSLSNSQSRYEQGLHTKRKEHGNFDNAVKSKRQAVQGANASDHGQLLASEPVNTTGYQLENQEAANLMQINQQLRAKCLEYEKGEEELELKVIQLKGEIEEVENEYKRLLAELEAMEVTKTEKNFSTPGQIESQKSQMLPSFLVKGWCKYMVNY